MACAAYAQDEEANGVAAETQRRVSAVSITAGRPGGGDHQSDPAWLGQLLRHGTREQMLSYGSTLGRIEGQAPYDAVPETERLRLG